ncbi:DUF5476 domain-containing protein [Pseudomonas aeruginosa]|nr:DUF5476 domain-containing protein [Pseudomonas aeruginosa]MBH9228634.1 DUF5476 domain-containing protein [Pseudomonas aeruginosa]
MCFSSKVKTPKVSSNIPAPTPVLEESPKGVEFGAEDKDNNDEKDDDTKKITKIDLEGDSSETPSALSTATSAKLKKSQMSGTAVRKSLSKKAGSV